VALMTEPRDPSQNVPGANWPHLRLRAELLDRLRSFFRSRGFLEVETPLLGADVVIDRNVEPFRTTSAADPRQPDVGPTFWLQPSPEAAMKRLMAAGAEAIYQVTRSFRQGEEGRLHSREFTIVEWYRRGDAMDQGIALVSELCDVLLERGPAERMSYRDAFVRFAEIDPHLAEVGALADLAKARCLAVPDALVDDRDEWLDLLLVELVEPHLGRERPTILHDYPASQAALAKVRVGEPPLAERFELYVDGIELANGYHELTDADELRRRFQLLNRERTDQGRAALPEASGLLAAMDAGLPDCTGVALGFDRVVMLAAGASSIAQVMAFPADDLRS
jgi:lysyl-tRNA synthetase class 2